MNKEGSEVAFIPDNISNISSEKQKFNEQISQKAEQSYISKLTKLQMNHMDVQSGLQSADIKIPTQTILSSKTNILKNDQEDQTKNRIHLGNANLVYSIQNTQKQFQRKLFIHKLVKEGQQQYANQKRYQPNDFDSTYLNAKRTQTDVISQKESFVEEQQDINFNQIIQKRKITDLIFQKDDYELNSHKKQPYHNQFQYKEEPLTFVTEIDKFDEYQTEIGWLEHCVNSNYKFLLTQTNDFFNYNKAAFIEIQKLQLRAKIIQLQLYNNKLKIALRRHQSSKHINFSLDIKYKRPTVLKIPKKIDQNLRTYSAELQSTLQQLRKDDETNQKHLDLLTFYEQQFSKKVNYAFIYQEYLINKGKKQLNNTLMKSIQSRNSKYKQIKKSRDNSKVLSMSKKLKSQAVNLSRTGQQNKLNKISYEKIDSDENNSDTSLANQLKRLNAKSVQYKVDLPSQKTKTKVNQMKRTINTKYCEQGSITLRDHTAYNRQANNKTLIHHKQLSSPVKQNFINLSAGSLNQQSKSDSNYIPLFNTPNRQKKHFYYECQLYLRDLQENYLFQCEENKQAGLLNSQKGFRQRQFLKMKTLHAKNQILNTQVDRVEKKKQIQKENQILKYELKLMQDKFFLQFGNKDISDTHRYSHNSFKKINLLHSKSQNRFNKPYKNSQKITYKHSQQVTYKQLQPTLKNYKSQTMFESIAKPNIPKIPKKISQVGLQNVKNLKGIPQKNLRLSLKQLSDATTLIKTPNNKQRSKDNIRSRSPLLVHQLRSKSNNFLNRFKTSWSSEHLQLTDKQTQYNTKIKEGNPQKNIIRNSLSRTDVVLNEYYSLGM